MNFLRLEAVFDDRFVFHKCDGVVVFCHGCSSHCKFVSNLIAIDTTMGWYLLTMTMLMKEVYFDISHSKNGGEKETENKRMWLIR